MSFSAWILHHWLLEIPKRANSSFYCIKGKSRPLKYVSNFYSSHLGWTGNLTEPCIILLYVHTQTFKEYKFINCCLVRDGTSKLVLRSKSRSLNVEIKLSRSVAINMVKRIGTNDKLRDFFRKIPCYILRNISGFSRSLINFKHRNFRDKISLKYKSCKSVIPLHVWKVISQIFEEYKLVNKSLKDQILTCF